MDLYTKNLYIGYANSIIVDDLNIDIPIGKITALVGANGSGKSTILKTISRLLKQKSGDVFINGKTINSQSTREIAKQLAVLPQNPSAPDGLTVRELVSYGRFPYQRGIGTLSDHDNEMIDWAISVTNLSNFSDREIDKLSGGQKQRAWIAMALSQETDILFLDEPTTFLDMSHQLEILKLLKKLNTEESRTIVMVVHDLNHASRYADFIIAIKNGKIVKQGTPLEVMTNEVFDEVFNVKADIFYSEEFGVPLCFPYDLC